MKKALTLLIVLSLLFLFVNGEESGAKKLFVEANGNFLFPSDSVYKDVYGSSVFYPGFEAGYKIVNNIYIFAGFEMLSVDGTTPVLEESAKSTQNIFSVGVGYAGDLSDKFGYRVELGGSSFSYKEEAFGEEVTGSKFGFLLKGGLSYDLSDSFYAAFFLGYSAASDNVDGTDIKLGGFKTSLGVGVKF